MKFGIIGRAFPIWFCGSFQFTPVIKIRGKDRNLDAFFGEQHFSNLSPRLAALAQLADEFKVRFQDAAEWFFRRLFVVPFLSSLDRITRR